MNNDLTNEINDYRGNKFFQYTNDTITRAVIDACESLSPGVTNGLSGLSAEEDGVTRALWLQAVQAAEMNGDLVFPRGLREADEIPADAEPISQHTAKMVIAGRVARAILILNGFTGPEGPAEDWYLV